MTSLSRGTDRFPMAGPRGGVSCRLQVRVKLLDSDGLTTLLELSNSIAEPGDGGKNNGWSKLSRLSRLLLQRMDKIRLTSTFCDCMFYSKYNISKIINVFLSYTFVQSSKVSVWNFHFNFGHCYDLLNNFCSRVSIWKCKNASITYHAER